MRYEDTKTFESGERRPAKVGTTVPQVINSSAGSLRDKLVDEAESLDHSSTHLVMAVREWIRANLDKMRTFLTRMSLSNLQPGRTRWGPPWQWKRIEDEGPPRDELSHEKEAGLERVLAQGRKRATDLLADKTKHAPSRKGSARSRYKKSNGLGMSATRGNAESATISKIGDNTSTMPIEPLKSPRSDQCGFHGDKRRVRWTEIRTPKPEVYGSSNVRIQRWVSCLPIGTTHDPGRQREYLSPPLTPVEEGG